MKHQFTLHHLIGYLYNECSLLEKAAIEQALKEDAELALQLEHLHAAPADFVRVIDGHRLVVTLSQPVPATP